MPEFIVRARKAPTDASAFLAAVGKGIGIEYLAQIITNTLFVSKGHRQDAVLTLVLEDSKDFSRAITLDGGRLGSLPDLTEAGLLMLLAEALRLSGRMEKEAVCHLDNGIVVQAISFEHLVKVRLETVSVFLLDKKGVDIREAVPSSDAVYLLTDHIPMPKKTFNSLKRQGVKNLSLGPIMLHASQCVVLIQNEYDRLR